MSENNNSIYNKALVFTVVALVVVLVGTIVTVFIPMMTTAMHPKLETHILHFNLLVVMFIKKKAVLTATLKQFVH